MFVLLFYAKLLGFFSEGPLWFKYQTNEECDKHWWTNLLYINNIYPGKDEVGASELRVWVCAYVWMISVKLSSGKW